MPEPLSFDRPFPALTPAQRYHLDVFGYTIVPGVLTQTECSQVLDALRNLRECLRSADDAGKAAAPMAGAARPSKPRHNNAYFAVNEPCHQYLGHILESDPIITAYATHPRLVSMAEELLGGEARIVEMNAHLNRRLPNWKDDPSPKYGFHRGTDIPFGTHATNGLFHCNFVKTLTNLTDLGPDDGGTVVIAGSHKVDVPTEHLIAAAYEDRSLIHQVIAPAGSTLLFPETLIHATGQVRSEKERAIIITGYGASMFPYWDSGEFQPEFVKQIPPSLNVLIKGKANWTRGPRYRTLGEPADPRRFALGHWADRPAPKPPEKPPEKSPEKPPEEPPETNAPKANP